MAHMPSYVIIDHEYSLYTSSHIDVCDSIDLVMGGRLAGVLNIIMSI